MTVEHNLSEFKREAQAIRDGLRADLRERLARVVAFGYEALVAKTEETGSVDTGAYRAEHAIYQGSAVVYEDANRIGPTQQLPSRKPLGLEPWLDAPDPGAVAGEIAANLELEDVTFVNDRTYADRLEDGDSQIEPRQIYATAADATAAYAEQVASEAPRIPE